MYNNILPQKCIVNISIFFQKFNTVFFFFQDSQILTIYWKSPFPIVPEGAP